MSILLINQTTSHLEIVGRTQLNTLVVKGGPYGP